MIVKIVCAGEDSFTNIYQHDENEYIIGCDGGAIVLKNKNVPIDILIGDFDSSNYEDIKDLSPNIKRYKSEKDQSDLELALEYALKMNYDKIEIYNVTGLRQDHFLSSLNLLKKYHQHNIFIYDQYNKIYVSGSGQYSKNDFHYISFFAIDNDTIISLQGFKYNLENYNLTIDDSLCLSNEIISIGEVTTNKDLIIIESK